MDPTTPSLPLPASPDTMPFMGVGSGSDLSLSAGVSSKDLNELYVVFDDSLGSLQTLAGRLAPGSPVLYLDANQGLADLIHSLGRVADRAELGAMHLLSHGAPGQIALGRDRITGANLDDSSDLWRELGTFLSPEGDLLLYGCSLGSGPEGERLTEALQQLTGADVATSNDSTGAATAARPADWDLEVQAGPIEASSHQRLTSLGWEGTLPVPLLTALGSIVAGELVGWGLEQLLGDSSGSGDPSTIVINWIGAKPPESPLPAPIPVGVTAEPVTSALYLDTDGDLVNVQLSGAGAFKIELAGGLANNADATRLVLSGTDATTSLSISVSPVELKMNAGSIKEGERGLYNRMFSGGFTSVDTIVSEDIGESAALKSLELSGAIANNLLLPDFDIENITLDTGYAKYVDRINTSSLYNSTSIESVTEFSGNTISNNSGNASEVVDFAGVFDDEASMSNGSGSYNPVSGLIDLGDIRANNIGSLVINGTISTPTGDPYDQSFSTNDIRGDLRVSGRIGSIEAMRSRLAANIKAGSIGSIDVGRIDGSIATTNAEDPLTVSLPADYQGFITAAGHLNLSYAFDQATTASGANRTLGEIRSFGGISGVFAEEDDPIYVPDQYAGVVINRSRLKGVADININGMGMSRWKSAGDIGSITANVFAPAMIVEAAGNIGDLETYLYQEVPQEEPLEPGEPPVLERLDGFFQAGGSIGNVQSATSVGADLRAINGSIGTVIALTGGIESSLIEAGSSIGSLWAHNQAVPNQGKIVAQTGDIGDVYLGIGSWGATLRAGMDIGDIYIEKGSLSAVSFAAGRDLGSITVKGSDAIVGGTIAAGRAIGDVTVSAGKGRGIFGTLVQAGDAEGLYNGEAIASIGTIKVTAYGARELPEVEAGPAPAPQTLTNAIENAQILSGSIAGIRARAFTGDGIVGTVIHAQQTDVGDLHAVGSGNGIRRVNVVAEGSLGAITGLSQVQGDGILRSRFFANTGAIGQIRGRGGVAGGAGLFEIYTQSLKQTAGFEASTNANGGHAIQSLTANAGRIGEIRTLVRGGEGGPPQDPFASGIVGSTITTHKDGIGLIDVDTRSLEGFGISNSLFDSSAGIDRLAVRSVNATAIEATEFITSQSIGSLVAEAENGGTAINGSTFLAKRGGIGSEGGIKALSGGGAPLDHAIAASTFTSYTGIGAIEARSSGGSAILNSTFDADSGFTNVGTIASIDAVSDGINLVNSTAISGSSFIAATIGDIQVDVSEFRGGAAIFNSSFTARTAIYKPLSGAFENEGTIGSIRVRNASRSGNGIDNSTFLAGAAGRIGAIAVNTLWKKQDLTDPFNRGASGKAIYLSSFRATGLDPDQAVMNGRIGDITITAGRVIPQILDPGLPPPNDQWTAAVAGIDLSYFAAYGGIGNVTINTIGTALFGSALLANTDPVNGLLGTALAAVAVQKPSGGIGSVVVNANGRFASGIVLSALVGDHIRSLDIQARGGPTFTLPIPPIARAANASNDPLLRQIATALRSTALNPILEIVAPNTLSQFRVADLLQPISVGLAPVTASIFAATKESIGAIKITNLNGGDPFLGAIFFAKRNYGPVTTTPVAAKKLSDPLIQITLAGIGVRPSNIFSRYLTGFIGTQTGGGNLPSSLGF